LSEQDIEADIGPGLRMVTFACDQAWLYPGEGEAGIYAIDEAQLKPLTGVDQVRSPPQPPTPVDPFIARHLAQARFSFNCPDCEPGFALYESPGLPSPAFTIQTASSPPLRFPIALDGPLDLVGVQVYSDNNRLEIETWWRVTTGVIDRPFSIMAHLGRSPTPGEGEILAVADGAGVWPLTLRSGDIVVQRHPFPAQAASTALWLRTGAYWADSMERWACAEAACDSVLISLP
jgi:hypothetical protein